MKSSIRPVRPASKCLALVAVFAALTGSIASALTVPVAQDTCSAPNGKVAAANGKAVTLVVSSKQTTLLRFDLSDLNVVPASFHPGNIKSATLRLYVVSVKSPAAIAVHAVTTNWQEHFTGAPVALPTIAAPVVMAIPAGELSPKNFAHVDVTASVIAALGSGNDFGFALQAIDPATRIVLASKEGPATGYSAELEIEANTATDDAGNLTAHDGTFSGLFNISTCFTVEPRPNSTGGLNNFIGQNAGAANTTGLGNTFVGHNCGQANIGGSSNSFFGLNAGSSNTTGQLNVFLGQGAGAFNTSGSNNNYVGQGAGFNTLSGNNNNFFGWKAGYLNAHGNNNTFVGDQAGYNNDASNNVFVGAGAGQSNSAGTQNAFLGINAGNKTTSSFNSFFGAGAGQYNTTGLGNTAMGNIAAYNNTTGKNNTFLGGNTGGSNTVEDNNTFVGDSANGAAGITNSTALGRGATVTVSNAVVLGNNCSVGIGTSAPNSTLQVNGSLSLPVRSFGNSVLTGLGSSDYVLILTGNVGVSVVLPQSGAAGRVYVVKNRSTVAATLGFASAGPLIEGGPSLNIPVNTVVQVISDGTNWFKIN